MGSWDSSLYGSDDALDARGNLLAEVALPDDPRLFAACIGLLALLDPTADQFDAVGDRPALAALPPGLREAALVAAKIGASGPSLPYTPATTDLLGIPCSYGRVIDPLLAMRESITVARSIRDRCSRIIDEGFAYGETSIGGVVGLLLELRELGIATNPDLVDAWSHAFDRMSRTDDGEDAGPLRDWTVTLRASLQLLAQEPERKLLGADPTSEPRKAR